MLPSTTMVIGPAKYVVLPASVIRSCISYMPLISAVGSKMPSGPEIADASAERGVPMRELPVANVVHASGTTPSADLRRYSTDHDAMAMCATTPPTAVGCVSRASSSGVSNSTTGGPEYVTMLIVTGVDVAGSPLLSVALAVTM